MYRRGIVQSHHARCNVWFEYIMDIQLTCAFCFNVRAYLMMHTILSFCFVISIDWFCICQGHLIANVPAFHNALGVSSFP